MIKYVEYDAFDEHGQHIIPVNSLYHMNKVASGTYSPELMKVILNMKRREDRYYVVINALGSHEVWGCNRNGDSFPESGLIHKSLRTDMGTVNDYGYKTFEYYAKLYKHHVNKDPNNSFGEVIFSHWNPLIHRVELVVAININLAQDIVSALDKQEQVSVSMGCKVKYDRCSICQAKAATREKYCKHLKEYMREIVTQELARQWSIETGHVILPGTQVFAWNDYPRFFDISKVYIGADRTSYILGKAASKGHLLYSSDLADAKGVTDIMIDKIAKIGKEGEIEKELGGAVSPSDVDDRQSDGIVVKSDEMEAIKKSLDEKINNTIAAEPRLPNDLIDPMASSMPLKTIFSTLFGLGIHPKPQEFQRIILVRSGNKGLADELDRDNIVFDHNDLPAPTPVDFKESDFSDTLGKALIPFLSERSCFPSMLGPRMKIVIIKTASAIDDILNPKKEEPRIDPSLAILGGVAALYAGMKLKAMGYGPQQLAATFMDKPWLQTLIGGSVMWKIYDQINKSKSDPSIMIPARDYANTLPNTNLSGHIIKQAAISPLGTAIGTGLLSSAIVLPAAYAANAWNQKSLYTKGKSAFPGAGTNPKTAAGLAGAGALGGSLLASKLSKTIPKVVR